MTTFCALANTKEDELNTLENMISNRIFGASMAGAIAACMYPIPDDLAKICHERLPENLREINDQFLDFIEKRKMQ